MANTTIPSLNSIAAPSSAAMLWVADPGASPEDRSLTLANLLAWVEPRVTAYIAYDLVIDSDADLDLGVRL